MKTVLAVVLSLTVAIGLVSVIYLCSQKKEKKIRKTHIFLRDLQDDETDFTSAESKWFELSTLRDATDNFSNQNKLGQGGFGSVYKGTLKDGQDIAVKRLSATSGQGLQELRNEVIFVAKLQHRNLVRLLGCCLDNNEKLLVYEYLPNSSLDKFLFDDNGSQQLDWSSRYKIIEGIARGLLYLHEDSRLRIIHRDLKASNILLDENMNPKISDFGLAKHFGLNETQANTTRIAGTHGYMAPEYLMRGEFSPKSDVFSYGVLVLEIVTGQKNRGVVGYQPASDLVNNVYKHWNEGKALELKDKRIGEEFPAEQVLRCIHIGLLCVQEDPTKRPCMALAVNMLSSYSTSLPPPLIPGFFSKSSCIMESDEHSGNADIQLVERRYRNDSSMQLANLTCINEISMSDMEPR
ncbi:LOW QUALITY PROTEIN: cysteine-rich receptor-like protein kinase 10 [Dioscorea cayenensis subsp. rotundata]|uniref:LOW QUALITY PROTEIN: cysteine-rich receptor-like protein kinase 10 n=1 Tax=Dioscorea cayennensis subsp. rotundata TaxID=55577 RepID=A0AB40CP13_DIOCR|nr:LOW QUALITY PROTEIN: cysteine-rich receptor-like protein kinase 10 [Dioscorea cayenensis subsp. rotundata]